MENRTIQPGARYVVSGVAYLLSSYAALLVFCNDIDQIHYQGSADLTSYFIAWFQRALLFAGFFSLVHLTVVSFLSRRYRPTRLTEVIFSSAVCGVTSAYLFAVALRIVLDRIDAWLIPAILIAIVSAVLPALFVLESLRRRSYIHGTRTTRSTAVLLSSAFTVSCLATLFVVHLPMWPWLHLENEPWHDPHFTQNVPLFVYYYAIVVRLLFRLSTLVLMLWLMHVVVLTSFFRRWQNLPERWFALGSFAVGPLPVIVMEALLLTEGSTGDLVVKNVPLQWALSIFAAVTLVLLPTFLVFDALARRMRARAQSSYGL